MGPARAGARLFLEKRARDDPVFPGKPRPVQERERTRTAQRGVRREKATRTTARAMLLASCSTTARFSTACSKLTRQGPRRTVLPQLSSRAATHSFPVAQSCRSLRISATGRLSVVAMAGSPSGVTAGSHPKEITQRAIPCVPNRFLWSTCHDVHGATLRRDPGAAPRELPMFSLKDYRRPLHWVRITSESDCVRRKSAAQSLLKTYNGPVVSAGVQGGVSKGEPRLL